MTSPTTTTPPSGTHLPPTLRPEPAEQILAYFRSGHLPEPLRTVSQCVEDLARYLISVIPPSAERTDGIRHLLVGKDSLCRAATHIRTPEHHTPGQQPVPPEA